MILAGDIGGTKTVLALFQDDGDGLHAVHETTFASGEYSSLEDILATFLGEVPDWPIRAGCFGIAGPVFEGQCVATNLLWRLDEVALARALGVPTVKLLNDVEAAAYGMLHLPPEDFEVLNPGPHPKRQGNMAVIAAGTGLGEAILYRDGARFHPIATEGGHTGFAPHTDQEIALLQYLRGKFDGHVSYERILSGPGLVHLYTFLRDDGNIAEPTWLTETLRHGDPSPAIAGVALADQDPVCVAALELFCAIYGGEASNLALKCLAVGGVVVGGGIAPKLLPVLKNGGFMHRFTDRGRFVNFLQDIEVRVALNPRAPLLGAAHFARPL